MSASSHQHEDSDDEFESADEGEPTSPPVVELSQPLVVSVTPPVSPAPVPVTIVDEVQVAPLPPPPQPLMDGWGDWNIDDDQPIEKPEPVHSPRTQESVSSLSSLSSKKDDTESQIASDEDEAIDALNQQRSQRKKYRKKLSEPSSTREEAKVNTRVSRPPERRDEETAAAAPTSTKHDVKDAHHVLDRLAAQSPTRTPVWNAPWSNFGSFFSTAKQSVTTLTSTVSEGFSAVIESVEAGLGAPDPQQLAEMNRMAFKIKGETSDSEEEPEVPTTQTEKFDLAASQDGWLNALSLDKLTTTGMKVVSGSLDVLETVGKKTFDVINEADPDLRGTRSLLSKKKQPTLSEIIREAKTEKESKTVIAKTGMATFFQQFEKHQGLAHFEALELLSNQSSIVLQTMGLGNERVLEQIETYFQCDDDDDDLTLNEETEPSANRSTTGNHSIPSLDALSQRFTAYQTQLRSPVTAEKSLEVYESANQFLKEWDWMDTELDQKTLADEAIDSLAVLCARIIEYYRKTAEVFLMGCRSLTSYSIDIELLAIYQKQQQDFSNMLAGIPHLFAQHMKQISSIPSSSSSETDMSIRCDSKLKQTLLNQIFIQSSSSQTYASDAYVLLKPIITQSILYHTSGTR